MKGCTWAFLLLMCWPQFSAAQAGPEDPYAERILRDALALHGVSPSFVEKGINRLGDEAAIGIIRVLAQKTPEPDEIKNILSILREAFAAPAIIVRDADRQPRATLFLLNCLQSLPTSKTLLSEISDTRTFVSRAMRE